MGFFSRNYDCVLLCRIYSAHVAPLSPRLRQLLISGDLTFDVDIRHLTSFVCDGDGKSAGPKAGRGRGPLLSQTLMNDVTQGRGGGPSL